jgi:ABC-type glycerol-3-phosphate transport system substrate-binding protein
MRLSRRRLLGAAPLLPILLAGCGSFAENLPAAIRPATPTPTEPRRVRLGRPTPFFGDDRLHAPLRRIDPARHVRFELTGIDVGTDAPEQRPARFASLLKGLAPADAPDLVLAGPGEIAHLARADALHDLGPVLKGERWFEADDFWGDALRSCQARGKQLAVPLEAGVECLLYNRRSFQEAGVPPPEPGWTWDQFLQSAKALTRPGPSPRWGFHPSPFWPSIVTMAWQNGAELITADGARVNLGEPGTLRGMELIVDLIHTHKVAPPLDDKMVQLADQYDFAWLAIRSQEAAMIGQAVGQYAWWRQYEDVYAAELPHAGTRVGLGFVGLMVGIPKQAPDMAHSLNALRGLVDATAGSLFLPVRRADDLRAPELMLREPEGVGLLSALAAARFVPGDFPFEIVGVLSREYILPILTGKKRPAEAARDAQPLVDAELAKARG